MTVVLYSGNYNQVSLIKSLLEAEKVSVRHVTDRQSVEEALQKQDCIAVIIDLPNPTSEDIAGWNRLVQSSCVPVLLLSSNETDIQSALLRQRATLELAKPFSGFFKYLDFIRKEAGKTNQATVDRESIELAPGVIFDVGGLCVWRNQECLPLSGTEFKLLYLLAKNSGRRFTADELIDRTDLTGHSSLYFHIKNLREKIEEDPGNPVVLTHRRGYGYGICTQEIKKGE